MWTWRWFNDSPFRIVEKIMIGASRFKEKFGMNPDYVFINTSVACNVRCISSYGLTILRSDLVQVNEFGYFMERWL